MQQASLFLAVLTTASVLGCRPTAEAPQLAPIQSVENELLVAAKDYKAWGRVDEHLRTSVVDCRAPSPGVARYSRSSDSETHGHKLYSVFAKQRNPYWILTESKAEIGQVLVKETWQPEETAEVMPNVLEPARTIPMDGNTKHESPLYPYATKGQKVYKAGKPADLFIMMKLDPKTPDTDEGWVYGTVTSDGKTVTSAGLVESCMKCHQTAKHDRLFGLRLHE